MKKIAVLLILMVYSLASLGISLNYFYCCGKLKEVTIIIAPPHTKDCKSGKGKKCCENKTVSHKISVDQKSNQDSSVEPMVMLPFTISNFDYFSQSSISNNRDAKPVYKKPPSPGNENLNILLSTFRI